MPEKIRFDDAIPALAKYLVREASMRPDEGVFLRDGFGRVCFSYDGEISAKTLKRLQLGLKTVLGGCVFPGGLFLTGDRQDQLILIIQKYYLVELALMIMTLKST